MTLTFSFDPFPVLSTPRWLLRRCVPTDAPALFRMRSNPAVMQYVRRPLCRSEEEAAAIVGMMEDKIVQHTGINWAIAPAEDPNVFVGMIGIFRLEPEHHRGEVGYMLLPEYWGQGIVSALIPVVMRYGFETLGLHTLEAVTDPQNLASQRVLEKSGFVQEGYFRENYHFEGDFFDSVVFTAWRPGSGPDGSGFSTPGTPPPY